MKRDAVELRSCFWSVDVEYVEDRRREIDQLDEVVYLIVLEGTTVDEQRDVKECVVEGILVVHQPVIADVLAMITRHDEQGLFPLAFSFEEIDDLFDFFFEVGDLGAVERTEDLEIVVGQFDFVDDSDV